MRRVVVSVRRRGHTRSTDFELPTDVTADDLAQQLAEAVGEPVGDGALDLRVVSLGRALHPDETLGDAGVWDGATVVLARSADPPEQTVALAVAGGGSALATLAAPPPPVLAVPAQEEPRRAWLPPVIGGAVALTAIAVALYAFVLGPRQSAPEAAVAPAVAPTIASTSAPAPQASATPTIEALVSPTVAPTSSATVDDEDSAWRDLQAQLDQVWGDDWPATIGLLQAFHTQHPTRSAATDKLYAALVEYGRALRDADAAAAAAESFDQAVRLAPQRREAREELAALTPTPTIVVAEAEAPAPAPPVQREPPPALLPLPTTPPPAIPTPPPLEPEPDKGPAAPDCDVTRSDIACPLADGMRVAEAFVRPGAPHFFWFGVPTAGMHLHTEANGPACPCTFWIFSDQVDDGATPLMAGAGALDQVIAAPGPYLLELASDQSAEGDYSLAFVLQPAPEPTTVPEDPPTPLPPPPPPPPAPTPTPLPLPVPALVGAAVSDAQQRVLSAGLSARVQRADLFSPAGAGSVAAQDPPAGAQLAPGGSVTLLVASGNVQVPNVIGLFEQDAWAAVRQSGLDPDVRHVPRSDVEAGRAALLDPPAGSVVPAGSKVSLTISHGQ